MSKRYTNEEIVARIKSRYGDLYDTSEVHYVNATTNIALKCEKHGRFKIKLYSLMNAKIGCQACSKEARRMTTEGFITRCSKIHNNEYDYSKVKYITRIHSVIIICPKHKEFELPAGQHLEGAGCPSCYGRSKK